MPVITGWAAAHALCGPCLQALAYLALHYREEAPVLISTISREKNIPYKFLEGILCELRNEGVLTSIRGRNGGYRLAEMPKNITLARVLLLPVLR